MAQNAENIKSYEVERSVLCCLLKDSGAIGEIKDWIKSSFFGFEGHARIYECIIAIYSECGKCDMILLTSKLRAMVISEINGLNVYQYLESLGMMMDVQVTNLHDYCRDLYKYHFARVSFSSLKKGQAFISDNLDKPLDFIVAGVEKLTTNAITASAAGGLDEDELFVDLYGGMEGIIKERADREGEIGIDTPFPIFNKWYGSLTFGDLILFAAPAKVGKSTLLSYLAHHAVVNGNGRVKVLYLDTELESWRVATRNMAAQTGVNEYYYRSGKFKNDKQKVAAAEKAFPSFSKHKGGFIHSFVPDKNPDEIEMICKRWHNKFTKPGDISLIVYDYIKLTGDMGNHKDMAEYQLIGQKTNKLKMLSSQLRDTAIISSVQLNREGLVAQSDRIKWFGSSVFLLKKKTPEEISQHGEEFGTHKLVEDVVRNLGEDMRGRNINVLTRSKGEHGKSYEKLEGNYINLKIDNFLVTECGTLADAESARNTQLTPKKQGKGWTEEMLDQ